MGKKEEISMKKHVLGFTVLSVGMMLAACNDGDDTGGTTEETEGTVDVVATIGQIGEPLSVIAGDLANVQTLMGPGVDPHVYEASQSDIRLFQEADLIFYNGLHLEAQLTDVFNGVDSNAYAIGETVDTGHLLEDEEEAGMDDPHIWFDVVLWEQALDSAVEELKEVLPEHADELEENKQAYFNELDELYTYATDTIAQIPEEQRILVTAHDAFQYFGEMNDIDVMGIQGLSTESEAGISDIQSTIDTIVEKEVPAVFVESSVNDSTVQAVIEGAQQAGHSIELGGELFSDAMGEEGTEEGTYIGMYRHNVDTIHSALTASE